MAVRKYVFLHSSDAVFNKPTDWNDADNKIHCIGPGGLGFLTGRSSSGKNGGGGGGYDSITNFSFGGGSSVAVQVGVAGSATDTLFVDASTCVGHAGGNATSGAVGAGGAVGVGSTTFAGGNGGLAGSFRGAAGGGGAAGPHGAGGAGGGCAGSITNTGGGGGGGADGGAAGTNGRDYSSATGGAGTGAAYTGGAGGNNRTGSGGGAGTYNSGSTGNVNDNVVAQNGVNGGGGGGGGQFNGGTTDADMASGADGSFETLWTQTSDGTFAGPGGGGGGTLASQFPTKTGNAGGYGGGGAGRNSGAGSGGLATDGIIVVEYLPLDATDIAPGDVETSAPSVSSPAMVKGIVFTPQDVDYSQTSGPYPPHVSVATGLVIFLGFTLIDVATLAPAVGTPALAQVQLLTPATVATSSPSVAAPAVAQLQAVDTVGLSTAAPAIGNAALAQAQILGPADVTTAPPAVSVPGQNQQHGLAAADVGTGWSTAVDAAAVAQLHALTPATVVPAVPSLSQPAALINIPATAAGVSTAAPGLTAGGVAQQHGFATLPVTLSPDSVDAPAVAQEHALSAGAAASFAAEVSPASFTQTHTLEPSAAETDAATVSAAAAAIEIPAMPADLTTPPPAVSAAAALIDVFAQPSGVEVPAAVIGPDPAFNQTHRLLPTGVATPGPTAGAATVRRWKLAGAARTTYSEPQIRRTVSTQGGTAVAHKWPSKDPDEVLDYDHDHGPRVGTDDILTVSSFIEAGDVTIDSFDFLGTVQKTWLSGGTEGTKCRIGMRVTTRDGRTMDESAVFRVKSR